MKRAKPQRPSEQTVEVAPLQLRAEVRVDSIDVEARTAELIFSTGAPVTRFDWMTGQRYIEKLGMQPGQVRLGRLNAGAPFLNAHSSFDVSDVIGVVVDGSARLEKGQGIAKVRFSKRAAVEPIWQDVRDGILRNVSVGYRVHTYEQGDADVKVPTRTAVDWEPFEISAVPIPADAGAQVRAEDKARVQTNPCVIVTRAATTREELKTMGDDNLDPQQPGADNPNGGGVAHEEPTDVERARQLERERAAGILRACGAARMPASRTQELIAQGVELVEAQREALEFVAARGNGSEGPKQTPSGVRVTGADPMDHVWRGIEGALLNRIDPEHWKLDDNARQYRGNSLMDFARECLEQRGIRTRQFTKMEIAGAAMGLQVRAGLHTTSDFANILADVANKSLRRAYEAAPATWMPISRRIDAPDFKPMKRNQLGEAPTLLKVLEHGEFTHGTIAEGKEQFQLATYGRVFGITRQALVNDDLDAFGRLAVMFGRAARNLESDVVWYQILKNANMADSNALFSTAHANQSGAAGAIDVTTLGAGRSAMRKQTALGGGTYLNLAARWILCPPDVETVADQYTTVITPNQGPNVNPFAGRLGVIAEPRLAGGVTLDGDTASGSTSIWYLAASTDQIDILEHAYLAGEDGPVVETRVGFDVDGLETKCRHDFAAKAIDHRGLYRNSTP